MKVCASAVDIRELWRQIEQFSSEVNNTPGIFKRLQLLHRSELYVREDGSHFEHVL
jgi:hypothetical protein